MDRRGLKLFFFKEDNSARRGRCIEKWVKSYREDVYTSLLKETGFLPENSLFKERLYCIREGLVEKPKCRCGKDLYYTKFANRYSKCCSDKCEYYNIIKLENYEKTVKEKYGVTNVSKLKEIKEKKKQTYFKNYGVDHYRKSLMSYDLIALRSDPERYKEFLYKRHHIDKKSQTEIGKELGISDVLVGLDLKKYNIPKLRFYSSESEKEISRYVLGLLNNDKTRINNNCREVLSNRKELDIYIPSKKLAIEYNGLFWHSFDRRENKREINYHKDKVLECRDKGIRLFTIFENEWRDKNKKKIWKNIIKHNLIGPNEVLYARKSIIKQIDFITFKKFCLNYHLQGFCKSSLYLGAYINNELVSVMSFSFFEDKKQAILTRFCTKEDIQVIGIASKFFSYFLKEFKSIKEVITFADLRYSYGDLYYRLGFKVLTIGNPCYFYCVNKKIYHRWNFQRKHLNKVLGDNFDPKLTEAENMFNNGYRRIWDCGKIKFLYQR